jgi:glycolate oxidase FAD binding subunit
VVKNVAGYDLSKLVCGSCGSLAAIVSATFKLTPLPAASKTIVIEAPDVEALGPIVREVMSSQLEPIALDVQVDPQGTQKAQRTQRETVTATSSRSAVSLLLRFASLPVVVDVQVAQTQALTSVKGCATALIDGARERDTWDEHTSLFWEAPGAILRVGWLPANLPAALEECATAITELRGRAAVGAGLIRIDGDAHKQAAAIAQLRQSKSFHNVVVVRGSEELRSMLDVWGIEPARARLFASLKTALDPNNTLNAGRGPL